MSKVKDFFGFLQERHAIYLARKAGKAYPWTQNPILRTWKFTNVYRELDATTVWMRQHITEPNRDQPPELMLFNCAYFRLIGSRVAFDRGELPMFVTEFNTSVQQAIKHAIRAAFAQRKQIFTGAYKILKTNAPGYPKEVYVVDDILVPLWAHRLQFAALQTSNSLERVFATLHRLTGFGGTGFMTYEVVTDLRWTSFFGSVPADVRTWANALAPVRFVV